MVNADPIEILLVEDNPQHVELTLRALRKHNLANNVLVAKDGAEALEFIFATHRYQQSQIENGPKVILLDLKLPKVDGLEVLRRLKSDERTKSIPVVVVTTSEQDQDVVKSYNLGANSYIVKPVSFEKFVEAVSQLGFYWMLLNKPPS
ncbi:MAG TPA: response regulator [Blastocatellia bacterium]|nr:response regulator [Blastocatellia bacterium]